MAANPHPNSDLVALFTIGFCNLVQARRNEFQQGVQIFVFSLDKKVVTKKKVRLLRTLTSKKGLH